MKEVIVIGAGAAGIMAALAAAEKGAAVRLMEKNNIVGKKLGITGKGRCNLTNSCTMNEFISRTPGNGKFLYSAYAQFTNEQFLEMVHAWGLKTKVERGGRVFPESDSAVEVRKLLYRQLLSAGVDVHLSDAAEAVQSWGGRMVVSAASGTYEGDACIITTGGMSYPVTGSTGDGYVFARKFGHTVTDLKPSLVPFLTKESWPHALSGLSLKNVEASLWKKGKCQAAYFGEMMFTHFGVSGPIVLMLSAAAAHKKKWAYPVQMRINLKPSLSREALDQRVQRDFQKYIRKEAENAMKDLLPQRLIPVVLAEAGIDAQMPAHQISREQRLDIVDTLQALPLTITGTRPVEEAIVTAGGVSVKEIDPATMESKLVSGLYFAGEVMDIDAFTGGYNLQAAFSTGYVAGTAAAREE